MKRSLPYKQITIGFVYTAVMVFCGAWTGITWAWPIPDTGLTKCYEGTYTSFTQPGRYSVIVFAENASEDRSLPYETNPKARY